MVKVIIDRTKWSRGPQSGNALLVGPEASAGVPGCIGPPPRLGTMCCLGFACKALGVQDDDIRDRWMPEDVAAEVPGLSVKVDGFPINTLFADEAARLNDHGSLDESQREQQLAELAAANGFDFQFIN